MNTIQPGQYARDQKDGLMAAVQIDCDAISPFGDMHLNGMLLDGTAWQALIDWTLARELGGLENLSLIPGSVGAVRLGVEKIIVPILGHAMDLASGRSAHAPPRATT